jgi:dsRNA-specific ribonuclease
METLQRFAAEVWLQNRYLGEGKVSRSKAAEQAMPNKLLALIVIIRLRWQFSGVKLSGI